MVKAFSLFTIFSVLVSASDTPISEEPVSIVVSVIAFLGIVSLVYYGYFKIIYFSFRAKFNISLPIIFSVSALFFYVLCIEVFKQNFSFVFKGIFGGAFTIVLTVIILLILERSKNSKK